jgi:hypothetical protein
MNFIFNILLIFFLSLLNEGQSTLYGKYCSNIFGNKLDISILNNTANISIDLFGKQINCNKELFNLSNNKLLFSNNQSDCLNINLKKFGACPCPPNIIYDNKSNSLEILDTPMGTLFLKNCN